MAAIVELTKDDRTKRIELLLQKNREKRAQQCARFVLELARITGPVDGHEPVRAVQSAGVIVRVSVQNGALRECPDPSPNTVPAASSTRVLKRCPANWEPVRVKKTRKTKSPGSHSLKSGRIKFSSESGPENFYLKMESRGASVSLFSRPA
jgi:hypothetical protein